MGGRRRFGALRPAGALGGVLAALAVGAASCVLQPQEGQYRCDPGVEHPDDCPEGWFCRSGGTCWSTPDDEDADVPEVPDDGSPDEIAPEDAPPEDGPPDDIEPDEVAPDDAPPEDGAEDEAAPDEAGPDEVEDVDVVEDAGPSCGNGIVESGEECDGDAPRSCTTMCSSIGTQACSGCRWAVTCTPPAEICNGVDDDCDSVADEGFGCAAGATRICATSCATLGEQTCSASCAWGVCVGTIPEACNHLDDDCDGRTDETFVLESDALNCGACGSPCPGGGCYRGLCYPSICFNGSRDDDESDVDCGGSVCPRCVATGLCGFGSDCESGSCSSGTCALGCNLMVNASGELGGSGTTISGWSVLENGGSGWSVEAWAPQAPNERGAHNFVSSYAWDRKGQTVDLVAGGFAGSQLAARPDIYVGEWIRRRWDSGTATTDSYYIACELRNASGGVITRWDRGSRASPLQTPADNSWHVEEHTFSGYAATPGAVYFEDGGVDREFWVGWYGTKFDGGRVTVLGVPCPSCHDGVLNQGETGVDCGGICAICP